MSQQIQVRRGINSARTGVVLEQGEPAWCTDTRQLYVGDGLTTGGMMVFMMASGVPAASTSPGVSGQMIMRNNLLYICTGNGWGRVTISTF